MKKRARLTGQDVQASYDLYGAGANAPATRSIFMSDAAHDRRARFIGTAKRTGELVPTNHVSLLA